VNIAKPDEDPPPGPFTRADEAEDGLFYVSPRKVVHLEPGAIEVLRNLYARLIAPGGDVLDLMSSWRSHLPEGLGHVTGLGLNDEEMRENPQLGGHVLQDLNRSPLLPFPDAAFDAVVCSVSVQYLIHPDVVFGEVHRVLKPGAPVIVSFSNRCFPTKAVAAWLGADDDGHRLLVRGYLEQASLIDIVDEQVVTPDDPLFVVAGRRPG